MIGAYGAGNLGDDAILQGMLILLEKQREIPKEDITVYSYVPNETTRLFGVSAIQRNDNEELPPDYDKLLVGGGGIFYAANAPLYIRRLRQYLKLDKEVEVYGVGTDMLYDTAPALKQVLNEVDALSVRTVWDKKHLEEIGVNKDIKVVDCPSLLVPTPPKSQVIEALTPYFDVGKPLLGITLKPWKIGTQFTPSFLQFLREEFLYFFTFVPLIMCKHIMDGREADEISTRALFQELELMDGLEEWFKLGFTPSLMKGIVQNMNYIISNRKHPLMYAAQAKIPATVVEDTPTFILSKYARCYGLHHVWVW